MTDLSDLFPYFIGALAIVALAGFPIFFRKGDAALKRVYFPSFVALCGVLLGAGILSLCPTMRFVVIFPIGFFGYACVRATKFCDRCGRMAAPNRKLKPLTNCPKCGAPLK